jgi:hypothetical protein
MMLDTPVEKRRVQDELGRARREPPAACLCTTILQGWITSPF